MIWINAHRSVNDGDTLRAMEQQCAGRGNTKKRYLDKKVNQISAVNFLEKIKSDEMWQKYSKALRFKEENASLMKYKKIYLGIEVPVKWIFDQVHQQITFFGVQQLQTNWRTAKYEEKTLSIKSNYCRFSRSLKYEFLAMDNDYLLFCYESILEDPIKFQMIDLRTMKIKPNVIKKSEKLQLAC